jgi:hypothetical protein
MVDLLCGNKLQKVDSNGTIQPAQVRQRLSHCQQWLVTRLVA